MSQDSGGSLVGNDADKTLQPATFLIFHIIGSENPPIVTKFGCLDP